MSLLNGGVNVFFYLSLSKKCDALAVIFLNTNMAYDETSFKRFK
jgi:hypothetical protein